MIGDFLKASGLIGGGILGILLLIVLILTVGGLFWGWIIMLVVGMLWHEFGILAPIGMFPVSFVLGVVTSTVLTTLGGGSKS